MKRLTVVLSSLILMIASFGGVKVQGGESWTIPLNPPSWSRDQEGFNVSVETFAATGKDSIHVVNHNEHDWAIRLPERIAVVPGEIFELTFTGQNLENACQPSVVLYNQDNEAVSWVYGQIDVRQTSEMQTFRSKFVIPKQVAHIEPRIVGSGESNLYVDTFKIERAGKLELSNLTGTLPAENEFLHVKFYMDSASFDVYDVRSQRSWKQIVSPNAPFVLNAEQIERGFLFTLFDPQNFLEYTAQIQLAPDAPEIVVALSAPKDAELTSKISYPYPTATRKTDRVILPVNEGISFPTTEDAPGLGEIHTFGGHGLCMAFWGVMDDELDPANSEGMMTIVETPDDSAVFVTKRAAAPNADGTPETESKTLSFAPVWHASKNKFGYDRVLRFVYFDQGGYVAQCKRYQEYAKEIGLHVTFDEKIKKNPALADGLDRLIGAANIWCWDWNIDKLQMVKTLKDMGFDRILWSSGGSPEVIKGMNAIDGVLTSQYDIYQDVMDPEKYPLLPYVSSQWLPEAWPRDLAWIDPNGTLMKGWEVDQKDITQPRIPCGVLCAKTAVPYAEKQIGELLKTTPYLCRFLDTTVASPWRECWNPDHPMTRTECKIERMKLLALLGERFNLVCGSETGIDASVPFCDYYEGMASLGPYRGPESGRYLEKIWDEVPPLVEKYQVGEEYRLPLFELVYHGCVVSYWYWGDHNNKHPKVWEKRDLFNALYGIPPMYGFTTQFLEENRDQFIKSYQVAQPVSRLTGKADMVDHQILTKDRQVQRSVFSNGISVIVNFSDAEYHDETTNTTIPPKASQITKAVE